jgi:transposase
MRKRKRRTFTGEFKREAVRLCEVGDRSIAQVAKDLDLTETALREWVKRAEIDAGKGPVGALTTEEREELTRLRRENKRLQMEREILKKAAVGSRRRCNVSHHFISRRVVVQRLARARVEAARDRVEILLSVG